MLSPIGNSSGYYTSSPYATGHTAAAAHTALINSNHDASMEVQAVADVPEVFSNEETERVQRTPEEQTRDRLLAYELMTTLNPRNAEHLNAPLEFMTRRPFEATEQTEPVQKNSQNLPESAQPDTPLGFSAFYRSGHSKNVYEAHLNAYNTFSQHKNNGFLAMA